jgi:hypothetical protein
MFNLKELLDGLVELMLDLPLMFVRTHTLILSNGPRGPALLARALLHEHPRYLRPKTIAFREIVILFILAQGVNEGPQGAFLFAQNIFTGLFGLNDSSLHDRIFIGFLGIFFTLYYAFYGCVFVLRLREPARTITTDACLYYSTLCMFLGGGFIIIFLGPFNAGFSGPNEWLIRSVLIVVYGFSFGQLGTLLSARLKLHRVPAFRYAGPLVMAVLCFFVYATVIWISFGKDGIGPD